MRWTIYTKVVQTDGCVALRWFWRAPARHVASESPHGFVTRRDCEADAAGHGLRPHDAEARPFWFD